MNRPDEFGYTTLWSIAPEWFAAVRVAREESGVVVEEVRLLSRGAFDEDAGIRAAADAAFWGEPFQHPRDIPRLALELPTGGITATALRNLPWGEVLNAAKEMYREQVGLLEYMYFLPDGFSADIAESERKPGRRGRPDLFYAKVAKRYLSQLASGDRRPIQTMAAQLGYAPDTVSGWLKEARGERGLLTAVGQGRKGGELTEKALDLIARNGKD